MLVHACNPYIRLDQTYKVIYIFQASLGYIQDVVSIKQNNQIKTKGKTMKQKASDWRSYRGVNLS